MADGSFYSVEVRPDASGWSAKLEAQIGAPMRALAAEFERRFKEAGNNAFNGIGASLRGSLDPAARSAADNLRDQLRRGIREGMNGTPGNSNRQGNQQGRQFGDAFSREVKAKLEAAFRSLPDAPLKLNSSAADVEIAEIRAKLQAATKDIELGVDTAVVDARVEALQARLKLLAENSPDVRVQVNTTAALAQIEAFRAALARQGAKGAEDFTDKFTTRTRERLTAAFKALPKIEIDANSSEVDKTIAEIRAKLEQADADIKLGVDQRVALAELDRLQLRLRALSVGSTDIRVRVNAGTALAELEALKRASSDDNRRGNVFTRLVSEARLASPAIDAVIGKLGSVGGALSSIGGNNLVGALAIVAAIVAAISTIGPLVAAASGALLGLGGAAGVAALAVVGLKKQMAQSTGFGEQIGTQFKSLTREIGGLGEVAANAVGPALLSLIQFVRNAVPSFQGLVTLVGGRLGGAFRSVGVALVTAFQKASPLIVEVAGYIEQGAAALARWVAGPGFASFLAYARKELPIVIADVGKIGKALIDVFVALAPLGEKVLSIITSLIQNSAAIVKILSVAFKYSGGGLLGKIFGGDDGKAKSTSAEVDSLLSSFQNLGNTASNVAKQAAPLDNYVKIIGDLAPALQLAAGNSGQFQVAVTGITDRLRAATPALQEFMDTAAAYDPASAKVADTAKLLGDAFNASRGNALDYTATIVAADTATQGIAKTLHDNIASVNKDGTLLGVSHLDAAGKFVDASNKYSEGSSAIVQAFQSQVKAATDAATATYTNELATKGQATAANDALTVYKGYRQSLIDSAVAAGTARDTAKALADQYFAIPPDVDTFVKLLGQDNVSLAIQGLTDALNRLSDFIGAPKVELNDTDFKNSTAVANSTLDYFGQRKATPSIYADTAPFGVKMGQSSRALDEFNGRSVYATVAVNDNASGKIRTINGLLLGLHDKTIYINTVTGGNTGPVNEFGGVWQKGVRQYAFGGVNEPSFAAGGLARTPQITQGSSVARYAELSTQGEAFIPFNPDRRGRAENILADVARRFDGAFIPDRAISAMAAVPSGGSTGSSGLSGEVVVNVIDRDGSFVERMRGEIARTQGAQARAAVSGSASVVS